jgi:hypothetical protein
VRAAVIDLGSVSEAEKSWLLANAALVLYPTVQEGFGLVPFEAAAAGVPCMWASGTALNELLAGAGGGIVPWDAAASADAALELMRSPQARSRQLDAVRSAGRELTWDAAAAHLLELYLQTCDAPAARAEPGSVLGVERPGISEDAIRLVGPSGALPAEIERPLLALATRPRLAAPVFAAIKMAYRLGRGRRRGR